jgi:hypothetical protein
MLSHDSLEAADRSDAATCWSAVLHLRAYQQSARADEELTVHLKRLLSAVGLELEADLESIPKAVRCAAVDLAAHIVRRPSIPVPRRPAAADEPVQPPDHRGHAPNIPFSPSILLGRMG